MKITKKQIKNLIKKSIKESSQSQQLLKLMSYIEASQDYSHLNSIDVLVDSLKKMLPQKELDLIDQALVNKKLQLADISQIPDIVYEAMGVKNDTWEPVDIGRDYLGRVIFKTKSGYDMIGYKQATKLVFQGFNQKYGKNIIYAVGQQATSGDFGPKLMLGKTAELYLKGAQWLSENLNISEYDFMGFSVNVRKELIDIQRNTSPAFELRYNPNFSMASIAVGRQSKLRSYSRSFDAYTDPNVFVYIKSNDTSTNTWGVTVNGFNLRESNHSFGDDHVKFLNRMTWKYNVFITQSDQGLRGQLDGLEVFQFLQDVFPQSGNLFKLHSTF